MPEVRWPPVAKQTSRGGQRLTKGKAWRPRKFIDAAIAFVMARDLASREDVPAPVLPIGEAGGDRAGPEFAGVRKVTL